MTLRLLDSAYQALKRYAGLDKVPTDPPVEGVADIADLRRRCAGMTNGCGRTPKPPRSARRGRIATSASWLSIESIPTPG